MGFRDERAAHDARIASLEARAAEADELRERLRVAEARIEGLEARLAEHEPTAPGVPRLPREAPAIPPYDLADPRLRELAAEERWSDLCELYEEHARHADPAHRLAALHRLASVQAEHLADPGAAAETLERALEVDAADAHAIARLLAILEEMQDWARLQSVLTRAADVARDPRARAGLLERRAHVELEQLADPQSAERTLAEARASDPRAPGRPT